MGRGFDFYLGFNFRGAMEGYGGISRDIEDMDHWLLWSVYPLLVALLAFLLNPLPLVPIVEMCAILFSLHLIQKATFKEERAKENWKRLFSLHLAKVAQMKTQRAKENWQRLFCKSRSMWRIGWAKVKIDDLRHI